MKNYRFFLFLVFSLSGCVPEEERNCDDNYFEFEYEFINRQSLVSAAIQFDYTLHPNECHEVSFRDAATEEIFSPGYIEKGATLRKRIATSYFPEKQFQLNSNFYSMSSSSPLVVGEGDLLQVIYEDSEFKPFVYKNGAGGGGSGDGDGNNGCSKWFLHKNECASLVEYRTCQVSEDATSVTVYMELKTEGLPSAYDEDELHLKIMHFEGYVTDFEHIVACPNIDGSKTKTFRLPKKSGSVIWDNNVVGYTQDGDEIHPFSAYLYNITCY